MPIRRLVVAALTTLAAFCAGPGLAYDGPMIDGHAHWGDSFDADAVIKRYQSSGVIAQVVMPRYLGVAEDRPTTDEKVLTIAQRFPGQIFVLAGMQRPDFTYMDWNAPDQNAKRILAEVDRKLSDKKVYGIGELLVRHWAYAGDGGKIGQHAEIEKNFNTVFVRQIAAIAVRHDVPLVIHMEGYPTLTDELHQVLKEIPALRLVWAHGCGRLNARTIRNLLEQHPNLYCDLSNMTNTGGYGSGWPRAESFTSKIEEGGILMADYQQLISDYSDRLFIGMDVAHQSRWTMKQGNTFEKRVQRTRELLQRLPPDLARKLAFENVVQIYKLPIPLAPTPQ